MSTAQIVFVVALAAIAAVITSVGVYVFSSTMWSDRWYRRRR